MRKILSPDDYDQWSTKRKRLFYAEAWALVHYLLNRPDQGTTFGQDMTRYIELVESGEESVDAFEAAFQITAEELDQKVRLYVERRRFPIFRLKIDENLPRFEPEVISLSREQASLSLGQIALWRGELDMAERWFTIAATDERTRPRAEAGRGNVLKARGEFEAARPHFERAVALTPNDLYCQLDLAEYWHQLARNTNDTDDRAKYLESARNQYRKAWKLDKSMPETYAMYGHTFVVEGRQYDKAIEMLEEAAYFLPSNINLLVMLAQAYMGANRKEDALKTVHTVLAWSHSQSSAAETAREILARLASGSE